MNIVRQHIVEYITMNWDKFHILTHNEFGDNYFIAQVYHSDMSRKTTFGKKQL